MGINLDLMAPWNWMRDIINHQPGMEYTDAWTTQYFKDYDKEINDYFMNKEMAYNRDMAELAQSFNVSNMLLQQKFEKEMSSTAYQRAMADMKAAGLNPASMVGSSAPAASTPSSGLASNSGASVRAPSSSSSPSSFRMSSANGSSDIFHGILSSVLASSRDARKAALKELEDNAKHLHRMDEIREAKQLDHEYKLKQMKSRFGYENDVNKNPKADYYDEKATELRLKRLGIK